jgi:hypothetical protein
VSKQLLIYETAVPLSRDRHGDVWLDTKADYSFSAGINAVPLMAVEFAAAAAEYAIVFTPAGDDVMPAAVLGLHDRQNLYLAADAQWKARYVPAFIRRYPFVFAASADGKTLTLCIDETYPGVNREGRGQRLFGADGQATAFTQNTLKFVQEYQAQFERTRLLGRRLKELGVLEPMQAKVTSPKGEQIALGNFLAASRARLHALDDATLALLAKTDALELVHLHLYSLRNFGEVKDRLIGAMAAADGASAPLH